MLDELVWVSRKDLPPDIKANLPEHIEGMRVSRTYKMMNCGNDKQDRKELQRELGQLLAK